MLHISLVFCFISNIFSVLDINQVFTNVWLSGAAYCNKDNYKTMVLSGPATGFLYRDTLYDIKTDLQGYIGVLSSEKTIYIVFRGSSSILNWMDDFEMSLVPYDTYLSECNDCKIHNGFYKSALGVKNKTIETVNILKKLYPHYTITVTGHSYGAAVAQIIAMELENIGISSKVYNYGQPRLGNKNYADFSNTILDEYWRITHYKDIVPHLPPTTKNGYIHSCGELYQNENDELIQCSEYICEDTKCSDQYKIYQTNADDHEYYLDHRVSCEESTIIQV